MKCFLTAAGLLLAHIVTAKTTCDSSFFYPYCVSVPDDAAGGTLYPTVLFLSGRGARGSASDVASLSTYDGFGKLVSQYNSGSREEAQVLAATKFITIVPVAPLDGSQLNGADPQYWYPEILSKLLDHVKADLPIDWDRFHVAGYSMGGFGSSRFAVNNPEMIASLVASGGRPETNDITNTLGQTATAPSKLVGDLIKAKVPIKMFTGTGDSTIPPSWLQESHALLESEGAGSLCSLTTLNTDHSGLSTIPFDATLLNWMLQQKRPGATSSSGGSTGGKKKPTKPKGKKKPKSKSGKSTSGKKKCTPARQVKRSQMAAPRRAQELEKRSALVYHRARSGRSRPSMHS